MAQGKMKVKAKVPQNAKQHSVHRGVNRISKGPKRPKAIDAKQLLQKEVTKSIRMNIEEEMRAKADKDGKHLSTKVKNNYKNSNNTNKSKK